MVIVNIALTDEEFRQISILAAAQKKVPAVYIKELTVKDINEKR